MTVRPDAWGALLDRADDVTRETMFFLTALQEIYIGNSMLTEEELDQIDLEAPALIPNCVTTILHQSRPEPSRSGVNRRAKLTPYRRPKLTPFATSRSGPEPTELITEWRRVRP